MRRLILSLSALVFVGGQPASAQDTVTEFVQQTTAAAARNVAEQLPAPISGPCVRLDVLMACVAFDEQGELRVGKEAAEPAVSRAGTIGPNLAAKLNEERESLPAGVSPGAAGANLLLKTLAGETNLQWLEQFQLRLIAGAAHANLQSGYRKPRVVGTATRSGTLTNSIEMENMGTLLGASVDLTKTGEIVLKVELERSAFGPEAEGTPVAVAEGKTVRTPHVDTMTLKTEVSLADGESLVVGSQVIAQGDKVTEAFVVVTATMDKP